VAAGGPIIAFDATSVPPNPAGAGTYTLNLAHALARNDKSHRYVVYARRHSLALLESLADDATIVDVGDLPRWRRQLWEQASLPLDLRRRKASLLHSPHHTTPLLYCPCPRVVTVHDVTFFHLPDRYPATRRLFFQLMTRLAARRAAVLLVPSASVREDLHAFLRAPLERIVVTYEGVDPSFRPLDRGECVALARKRYGLPEGYLLSLGTREPGKNREVLLRALRRLVDAGRDLPLAVVGQSGWRLKDEQRAVRDLGLGARVHFTGYVPQSDLPALYNAASVFVFPSLYEGFGLPALEALACGVPVVTSNVSALPEVVGDAALLVDPHEPQAIADAIGRALDDAGLRALLVQAGLERAAGFTWDACAEATLAAYRKVLGEEP